MYGSIVHILNSHLIEETAERKRYSNWKLLNALGYRS